MEWRGRRESHNVEDLRGRRSPFGGGGLGIPIGRMGRRGGGLGIGGVLVLLAISWIFGINPLALLDGGDPYAPAAPVPSDVRPGSSAQDELSRFVRVVLADTEDTWNAVFAQANQDYPEPTLVLFTGTAQSGCGYASAASGPFYCPIDRKLYIDLSFYEELRRRFQAPGDFAQAYVIAHEVGHHVQNLIGNLNRDRRQSNEMSIRTELQADCFAGIWGRDAADKGLLDAGDFDEAINAAAQVGDDAIQQRTQGRVVPESFNHGTSEQRKRWFKRGFDTKSLRACDTFGATSL
jgi:predicted metalloprotease